MQENFYLHFTGISLGLIFLCFIYYCLLNGFRIFVITSGSMEPAIKSGSMIITQPQARYHHGQVITFYVEKSTHQAFQDSSKNNLVIVTHRVVSSLISNGQRSYITQGDANSYPDKTAVSQQYVIGRVWLVIPFVGIFLIWIYSKLGFYFLVLLPVSLIIMMQIKNIIKQFINEKL